MEKKTGSGGRKGKRRSASRSIVEKNSTKDDNISAEITRETLSKDIEETRAAAAAGGITLEDWRRRALRAEEELQLTKALLLLRNVEVDVRLQSDTSRQDSKTIRLAGDAMLLKELMRVRGKLQLLQDSCKMLRADVMRLHMTIPQTSQWVLNAASGRLKHEMDVRNSLERRLKKLASLLK